MERGSRNGDGAVDYVKHTEATEGANQLIMNFSLIFYFVLLGETFVQYIFINSGKIWDFVAFCTIAAVIISQVGLFLLWRRSRWYGRVTVILFTLLFTYLNVISIDNNMILLLPVPVIALSMLYMSSRLLVELYLMWAVNAVIRYVRLLSLSDSFTLYQSFAWVVMICIIYAGAVYMVNESLSGHYKEVCHNLHHENKLHNKLYQQSTLDSTTGLLNRNAYNTYIVEYEEGQHDCIGCVYIDVNGLHEYNNTYGHQAGDKMLKTVAGELKRCFSNHKQYRIGGDEFVIISENVAFKTVLAQLGQFREQMKNHNIYIASGLEWRDENMNLNDMIKKADAKMFHDKERFYKTNPNGRDNGTLYRKAVE